MRDEFILDFQKVVTWKICFPWSTWKPLSPLNWVLPITQQTICWFWCIFTSIKVCVLDVTEFTEQKFTFEQDFQQTQNLNRHKQPSLIKFCLSFGWVTAGTSPVIVPARDHRSCFASYFVYDINSEINCWNYSVKSAECESDMIVPVRVELAMENKTKSKVVTFHGSKSGYD